MEPKRLFKEVVEELEEVVKSYRADGLLLSGGLDTSILACLTSRYFKPRAVTVGFAGAEARDLRYARLVAERFNLEGFVKIFGVEEAMEAARRVVKTVGTFDPMEVRNDVPLYVAMKRAKELGLKSVLTGDGADELFAGYSFLFGLKPRGVDEWVRGVVNRWFFAAKPIGESLGLSVLQPFLDGRVVELALRVPAELKVAERDGVKYGKYILRKSFEGLLPPEVVWRPKDPLEVGSGSAKLSEIFRASREEFKELSRVVKVDGPEQAYYLKLYLEEVGLIPKPKGGERACPRCGGGAAPNVNYCRICGAYPI